MTLHPNLDLADIDDVLDGPAAISGGRRLGTSRQGRRIDGYRFGRGPQPVSLIAGAHADEPVGPAMLDRLAAWLDARRPDHPLIERYTWRLVPHVNPDGEARNAAWTRGLGPPETWSRQRAAVGVDLASYLGQVVREKPGDDLEFGFPRSPRDEDARPEARAVADFLAEARSYVLHASFHGMAFAAGPWFLLEGAWAGRTAALRSGLRQLVASRGYGVHDIDRGGDKGFTRIGRGFTTRPDSRAMAAHFEALGDAATASLFRPSSMEFVRSLGGEPLTLVSEMPLFLLPPAAFPTNAPVPSPVVADLRAAALRGEQALEAAARAARLRPMPLRDQMLFQLAFLSAALLVVEGASA